MGRRLVVAAVLVGAAAFAPAAAATSQTASSGAVTATFTFKGKAPNYRHERLTISRAGVAVYSQPVVSGLCLHECAPAPETNGHGSVQVLDLEHNGQPDVVLELFSGGAHCCFIDQIFSYDPGANTYVKTGRNFGDPGARIVDLNHDGRFEFLTADDSFAYAFTDFAASGLPIQILRFSGRHFLDVTRSYPGRIAKDAARWLDAFKSTARQHYQDSVGVIAAWAADEDLLGHTALVNRYLAQQAKAGHLNTAFAREGERFVAKLKRFLRQRGYLR